MENLNNSGKKEVFCRYIRKNGKIIYPKNAQFFHFWVNADSENRSNMKQLSMFDDEQVS